ncbi:hypothetical protein FHR70_003870 [Microvirga lupini]|uniref:Transposase n=1 Tax=Microvirga lupini TaxID=420324 RepID=A0A7W4YXN8_9HYPH|nr:hypothetical protein [Microvirga lupini]
MSHQTTTEAIATIGIDLGKNIFHLIGMDARGKILLRRKIARAAAVLPGQRPGLPDRNGGLRGRPSCWASARCPRS